MYTKLVQYFRGELDEAGTTLLLDALEKDKSLKDDFIRMQNIMAMSKLSESEITSQEAEKSFRAFMGNVKKMRRIRMIKQSVSYAAAIILLVLSTFYFTMLSDINNNKLAESNTLYVPSGQRAKLILQDGTTVWMNANSTLRYPSEFSGKYRKVELTGEAYFDVATNKKKPFIVSSQSIELKVLGTQFNINSYPETGIIQTDLVEGSLMVYHKNSKNKAITLKPHEQVTLKDGKMYYSKSNHSDYYLWKDGIYAFEDEKLSVILDRLELYYDVNISTMSSTLSDLRFTAKFRQRDGIEEILKIMQKVHYFTIIKDTENNSFTLTQ